MDQVVRFILSNFTLIFFGLGLLAAGLAIRRAEPPVSREAKIDKLLKWFVFFSVGGAFLVNFILQGCFASSAAGLVGRPESPFQFELALACLAISAVGFLGAFGTFGMRSAALAGLGIFLWGMAAGQVGEMLVAGDFALMGLGLGFWVNLALPVFAAGLLVLDHLGRRPKEPSWF